MKRLSTAVVLTMAGITLGCAAGAPPSLPSVREALLHYVASDEYTEDLSRVAERARRWVERRANRVESPAIVLDIDETSLLNWPYTRDTRFCFEEESFDAWVQEAEADAVPGMVALYRAAVEKGVAVFFVTGRHEGQREATEHNLRAVGFSSWQRLDMRPRDDGEDSASTFKTRVRRSIEAEGYTILANVGDQWSDLEGGHALKTFKLPNPFYEVP